MAVGMHSQMLDTNEPFGINQEWIFLMQRGTWLKQLLGLEKNIYAEAKIVKSLHDIL